MSISFGIRSGFHLGYPLWLPSGSLSLSHPLAIDCGSLSPPLFLSCFRDYPCPPAVSAYYCFLCPFQVCHLPAQEDRERVGRVEGAGGGSASRIRILSWSAAVGFVKCSTSHYPHALPCALLLLLPLCLSLCLAQLIPFYGRLCCCFRLLFSCLLLRACFLSLSLPLFSPFSPLLPPFRC